MAFDPKGIVKNPAFAIAGGFVLGWGIIRIVEGTFSHLIAPVFGAMGSGVIRMGDLHLGCFGFLLALIGGAVLGVLGALMIKLASRE